MKKIIAPIIVLLVVGACLLGINAFTAPIIEKNAASKASGEYAELLPNGTAYTELDLTTLESVDSVVSKIVKEESGLGYIVYVNTTSSYTPAGSYLSFTMVVSSTGEITNMKLTNYEETKDFGANYPSTYVGQNGTLADVELVADVTFSSSAFKAAVEKVFATLVANSMIQEAKKSDYQVLKEMITTKDSAFADNDGNPKYEEANVGAAVIEYSYKALDGAAMGYIVLDNSNEYLVIVNVENGAVAYDASGNDVTSTITSSVMDTVKADASSKLKSYASYKNTFVSNYADATITDLSVSNVFSSVVYACKIETADSTLYGYTARTYGFGGEIMEIFTVVNNQGVISKTWARTLTFEDEYFTSNPFNSSTTPTYYSNFVGKDSTTFTDDVALMTGATITSKAFAHAVKDSLKAHTLVGGLN